MKLSDLQEDLVGTWAGTKHLWMGPPPAAAQTSDSRLEVSAAAKGKFLSLSYSWSFEGEGQEGLMILGNNNPAEEATAAWIDSFHMSGKVMYCRGTVGDDGKASVLGSYEAPPGPDWGWRITLQAQPSGGLLLEMYNITPDGDEALAVRGEYRRSA